MAVSFGFSLLRRFHNSSIIRSRKRWDAVKVIYLFGRYFGVFYLLYVAQFWSQIAKVTERFDTDLL
jgi:hypothetical protein